MANKPVRIHTIITHVRPHIDEIFAIWLLRKFGEFLFLGISTTKIEYRSTGPGLLDDKTAKQWLEEGVLLVGIGKGRLDEHSGFGTTEKKGDCCTTLVAKGLNVYSEPTLKGLIGFVLNDDTDKIPENRSPYDLGALVRARNMNLDFDSEKVLEMTFVDIDCFYLKALERHTIEKDSLDAHEEMIKGPKGNIKLVVIDSCDNEQIGTFSRSKSGFKADITVAKNTKGQVNISTNKKPSLKLYTVSSILNYLERKAGGGPLDIDLQKLEKEGAVEGGRWYYHKDLNILFNGGPSALDVLPTQISLDDIKKAIRTAMNSNTFDGSNTEKCRKGECVGSKCLWRNYNLSHCEIVWNNARQLVNK